MSKPDFKFSDEDLEDIASNVHEDYEVIEFLVGDERRWGFDRIVIFAANEDFETGPFYRFTYYEGSGDSEIDFEPTAVELVERVEVKKVEWQPVAD